MLGSSPLSRGIPNLWGAGQGCVRIIPALAGNTASLAACNGTHQDHPRSRGEYHQTEHVDGDVEGSSPLSRGIHVLVRRDVLHPRIIPALAGNTRLPPTRQRSGTDHPRSRGEYLLSPSIGGGCGGSSPLSRGIHSPTPCTGVPSGIIPALAGNTLSAAPIAVAGQDHPRSRGEYAPQSGGTRGAFGSSPLSRGIHGHADLNPLRPRIIPALAGNTRACTGLPVPWRDHPRSRGEYRYFPFCTGRLYGSSPLSRGIRRLGEVSHRHRRIIPALAGNTRSFPRGRVSSQDHPRSRGEYKVRRGGSSTGAGSSPLSRGIRLELVVAAQGRGIIPALAGNTHDRNRLPPASEDHPRSRGEYQYQLQGIFQHWGSSPLSRGIQTFTSNIVTTRRIIPALAGNTPGW